MSKLKVLDLAPNTSIPKIILLLISMFLFLNVVYASSEMVSESNEFISIDITRSEDKLIHDFLKNANKPEAQAFNKISNGIYLYIHNGAQISAGIYYLNIIRKETHKVVAGQVDIKFIELNDNETAALLVRKSGGRGGVGWEEYVFVKIKNDGSASETKLLGYSFDMTSGVCGRGEKIGISKGGIIKEYILDRNIGNTKINFDVIEQDCATMEKEEKTLEFNLK